MHTSTILQKHLIIITSVQEMEFAHSLRQSKVSIKICQVMSCVCVSDSSCFMCLDFFYLFSQLKQELQLCFRKISTSTFSNSIKFMLLMQGLLSVETLSLQYFIHLIRGHIALHVFFFGLVKKNIAMIYKPCM